MQKVVEHRQASSEHSQGIK